MKGKVIDINTKQGFIAIEIEHNNITVLKLLGGHDVEKGDVISGNLEFIGGEKLFNETQKENMSVFVQSVNCTKQKASKLMA